MRGAHHALTTLRAAVSPADSLDAKSGRMTIYDTTLGEVLHPPGGWPIPLIRNGPL